MHRATPANSSFRSYVAGGARASIGSASDSSLMQETSANMMANESRKGIESPQNFGFTSVVMDAAKSALGKMGQSAEMMVSFMGGNRSFPVGGNTDDRRHRLNGLDKGDSAMFTTKGRKQQMHFSDDGGFWSAPQDKTVRMALIDEDSEKDGQQQQGGGQGGGQGGAAASFRQVRDLATNRRREFLLISSEDMRGDIVPSKNELEVVEPLDASGGGGSSSSSGGQGGQGGQKNGQKSLKKKNQDAGRFIDVTKDNTRCAGTNVQLIMAQASGGGSSGGGGGSRDVLDLRDTSGGGSSGGGKKEGTCLAEVNKDSNFYCGAEKKKGKFALIVTVKGPTKNVPGKIG